MVLRFYPAPFGIKYSIIYNLVVRILRENDTDLCSLLRNASVSDMPVVDLAGWRDFALHSQLGNLDHFLVCNVR